MSKEILIRLSDEQHKQLLELMDRYQSEDLVEVYSNVGDFVKFLLQMYGLIDYNNNESETKPL